MASIENESVWNEIVSKLPEEDCTKRIFSRRLYEYRKHSGLSQLSLAGRINKAVATINNWERPTDKHYHLPKNIFTVLHIAVGLCFIYIDKDACTGKRCLTDCDYDKLDGYDALSNDARDALKDKLVKSWLAAVGDETDRDIKVRQEKCATLVRAWTCDYLRRAGLPPPSVQNPQPS